MPNIPAVQARRRFTKNLIDVFQERVKPTNFLRGFFPTVETSSKNVSWEVERATEFLADDVVRGTEGNRNEMSEFSEKQTEPPYFREYFDATDLDFYDQLFGQGDIELDEIQFAEWINIANEKAMKLVDKIERSIERQASQVIQTGIVTLKNGQDINFRRKVASIVDLLAGNYWDNASVNPIDSIETGCVFLRTEGKYTGGVLNAIAGSKVVTKLKDNPEFRERANLRRVKLVDLDMPTRISEGEGSSFHGTFSAGSWEINLWAYPQYYTDKATGLSMPYIQDNNFVLLPLAPRFKTAFGSVPKIIRDIRNAEFPEFIRQQKGAFNVGNYIDPRSEKHIIDVKSAPLTIPVGVDQMYTIKALAD